MKIGPFLLVRRLGQGAQGAVWKARRVVPPREFVALKLLNPVLARQPSRLAQFRREAERGARLTGPHLLQVIESGHVEGLPYLAMPFVEGITLMELIRGRQARRRKEPATLIHQLMTTDEEGYQHAMVSIMSRAAYALAQLHAGRVVHRDIKPANILIDVRRGGGVYLCDLGLGRDLEVATVDQMRDGAGTPMYMAPERLRRAPADEILCDLYSIGVTLFEALTLHRPFAVPQELPSVCLSSHLASASPRRPRQLNPEIPAVVEAVILRAMARDPRDRHQSALEFAGELDRHLRRSRVPGIESPGGHSQQYHPEVRLNA
jgi:serine/threonine-protein kinase